MIFRLLKLLALIFFLPSLAMADPGKCDLSGLIAYLKRQHTSGGAPLIYNAEVVRSDTKDYDVIVRKVIFDYWSDVKKEELSESLKHIVGRKITFYYYSSEVKLELGESRYFMLEKGGVVGGGGMLSGLIPEKGSIPERCFANADLIISNFVKQFDAP